jgi:hypothetical protein
LGIWKKKSVKALSVRVAARFRAIGLKLPFDIVHELAFIHAYVLIGSASIHRVAAPVAGQTRSFVGHIVGWQFAAL